jgi:hypothetical protein
MSTIESSLNKFIEKVSKVLPDEVELLQVDKAPMFGFELKLTGVKSFKGEPIKDGVVYEIEVPVYKGIMVEHHVDGDTVHTPAVRYTDHKHLLRIAYMKNGLYGIYNYLGKYMAPDQVDKVKKYFMHAHGKE